MPRRKVDPAVRAAATAEALAGEPVARVARRNGVSRRAVARWRAAPTAADKAEQVDARVFTLLLEALDTLSAHLVQVRDPAWVAAQNAHDLAIYTGVLSDKVLVLLHAVSAHPAPPPPPPRSWPLAASTGPNGFAGQ
jgi:hypothetical protein